MVEEVRVHDTEEVISTASGSQTSFLAAIDTHAKLANRPNDGKAERSIFVRPPDFGQKLRIAVRAENEVKGQRFFVFYAIIFQEP